MNWARLPGDCSDGRACLAFLAQLPVTQPLAAQSELGRLLDAMEASPPPARAYLEVLEAARPAVAFVQEKLAQRHGDKPLPPLEQEDASFFAALRLWRAMARGYASVARLGAADIEPQLALVCQRCLHYSGKVLLEHLRAHRCPEPGAWIDLHGYHATAEEWQIAHVPVNEPLGEPVRRQSCGEAYAAVLLADLSDLYGQDARDCARILRWLPRFAPFVDLLPRKEGAQDGFGVDLMTDTSARPLTALRRPDSVRRLETGRLAAEMQQVYARLKAGEAPANLDLGHDDALGVGQLLTGLYRKWCLGTRTRRFQRRSASGEATVCWGFEAIHYHVSGREFQQPEHVRIYSRADMEAIWTFRDQLDPTRPLALRSARIAHPLETWSLVDQSLTGFRLTRGLAGSRLAHGQLAGLRPPDGGCYLLGQISWHQLGADRSRLSAGIAVLPGVPRAVALRRTGAGVSSSERYVHAFLLPPVAALDEPASLVAPRGWFQAGRSVEIHADRPATLRVTALVTAGSDFERMRYAEA